jgi:ribosomal protein S18 acetylase RimI-like enzyme
VLDVAQDNESAVRLYERAGWRRVGELGPDDPRQIPGFVYLGPSPRSRSLGRIR